LGYKPRRRKERVVPWRKITAVAIAVLLLAAAGYFIYETYIYQTPPIYARVDTTLGTFYIELYPACAPKTVANFVSLADSGFYNDLVWHRIVVTSQFAIIQTGDPNTRGGLNGTRATWGFGGSNQTVPLEWCGWLHNYEGYIGMAHKTDVNSGTSQFYINLINGSENLGLDGNYTVFGRVISGMNVVDAISKAPLCLPPYCPPEWQADEPLPPVFVNDITILRGLPTTTVTT
jgi:cyclophilin family peptidyl-prolyl cis-trans isomerase